MGHKTGADLGGIRNLEGLRIRCRCDEDSGCWHWGLSKSQGPLVYFIDPVTGLKTKTRGRRAAVWLSTGHDVQSNMLVHKHEKCHSDDCVNPEHCRVSTRATFSKIRARLKRTTKQTLALKKNALAAKKSGDRLVHGASVFNWRP